MFEMNLPWWELVVRGTVVYLVLLLLVRLSGKRTVGQFTPFDLLVVMLLSEAVSGSLSGSDESLQGGLLVAAIVVALNGGVGFLSSRSKAVERAVDGEPVLIGLDGHFFAKSVKRHRLSQEDLESALRQHNCKLEDMKLAMLEASGDISIVQK
jgi:uncharacterized membrane protein YcaP (DUF421 family)